MSEARAPELTVLTQHKSSLSGIQSRTLQITKCWQEDVEKQEPSYTTGENVIWYGHHGGQYEGS